MTMRISILLSGVKKVGQARMTIDDAFELDLAPARWRNTGTFARPLRRVVRCYFDYSYEVKVESLGILTP